MAHDTFQERINPWFRAFVVLLALLTATTGCARKPAAGDARKSAADSPQRIVSLAPSITEVLFAMGLEDRVVGVTTFCNYPPAAKKKTRVGGYSDLSYETVLSLSPDLVVLLPFHEDAVDKLGDMNLEMLIVDTDTIEKIVDSVRRIGTATGKTREADKLIGEIRDSISRAKAEKPAAPPPRTLIVVERNPGTMQGIYVVGKSNFITELLEIAGGTNIFTDIKESYPEPGMEEMIARNPQVIIEMRIGENLKPADVERIKKEWSALGDVDAVKNGRIHVWTESYLSIPGPRIIKILEKLKRAVAEGNPATSAKK